MTRCPICQNALYPRRLECGSCGTVLEGEFFLPRLARLDKEGQRLAEALILHGGNLKEMSEDLGISYPTLKKRLTELSTALRTLQKEDETRIEEILRAVESGSLKAEEGIRQIREINHEL